MLQKGKETASYQRIPTAEGNRYAFYCDLCGARACVSEPIRMAAPEEELHYAWMTVGRAQFNRCNQCGKWVIDAVYNADVCQCVQCTPWEDQHPLFCKHCGAALSPEEVECSRCKKRVYY